MGKVGPNPFPRDKGGSLPVNNANGLAMGLDDDVCRPPFLVKQAKQASDVVIELLTVGERVWLILARR